MPTRCFWQTHFVQDATVSLVRVARFRCDRVAFCLKPYRIAVADLFSSSRGVHQAPRVFASLEVSHSNCHPLVRPPVLLSAHPPVFLSARLAYARFAV